MSAATAYREALVRIGGLSDPDKMPCFSYSTPATDCQTGSKLVELEGTTCSLCYARKGCYMFRSTREAMARRMRAVRAMLASPIARAQWVADFALVLNRHRENTERYIARTGAPPRNNGRFFRWHDSGDLQSVDHLRAIVAVADATPGVSHWLPTREAGYVKAYLEGGETLPRNLTLRVSVPRIDAAPAPAHAKLAAHAGVTLSGVHWRKAPPEAFEACGAYTREGACGPCRACWNPRVQVSYPLH